MGKSVAKLAVAWSDHKLLKDYFGVDDSTARNTSPTIEISSRPGLKRESRCDHFPCAARN